MKPADAPRYTISVFNRTVSRTAEVETVLVTKARRFTGSGCPTLAVRVNRTYASARGDAEDEEAQLVDNGKGAGT